MDVALESAIAAVLTHNRMTELYFNWNNNDTWCFSGTTAEGLGFETEDYGASGRADAIKDAIQYLEYYKN